MKYPFKLSSKSIEKELYKLIDIEKHTIPKLDTIIPEIAKQYFSFQQKFSNLIKDKIAISYQQDYYQEKLLVINDLIYIHKDNSFKLRHKHDYSKIKNGIKFSSPTSFYQYDFSIFPDNINLIDLFGEEGLKFIKDHSCSIEQPIKRYFLEHLYLLEKTYKNNINETLNFLINFNEVFHTLNNSNVFLAEYILQNQPYSKSSIYDIINSHNEVFQITCDINIEKQLEIMKKNQKIKKMEHKNESFV